MFSYKSNSRFHRFCEHKATHRVENSLYNLKESFQAVCVYIKLFLYLTCHLKLEQVKKTLNGKNIYRPFCTSI